MIRIPDRMAAPYEAMLPKASPRLYVHEGARQALERRFDAVDVPVRLSITDNRHSIISFFWEGDVLRARVHHMFLDAPASVQAALVRYVTEADAGASERIGSFIASRTDRLSRSLRRQKLVTRGKHHDLAAIFEDVNARYFGGNASALITWGRRSRRRATPRASIKLGSYDATSRLVRIHPALDRPWVPRYFVAFIVFHELLHNALPPRADGRRRELHSPEFRERERAFRFFERALAWEAKHLARLLRG